MTAQTSHLPPGRYRFRQLARMEWIKLRSLRSTWLTLAIAVAASAGIALVIGSSSTTSGGMFVGNTLVGMLIGVLLIGVVGVLAITSEYTSGTIRATFAAAPRRLTRQAMPAVEPVNFAVDDGTIVLRTDASSKLATAVRRAVVAFQADDLDLVTRSGWSVTVVGRSEEVTRPVEIAQLDKLGLDSWAPGTRGLSFRIRPGMVTGRWLRPPAG
jgi:hypothetical protein